MPTQTVFLKTTNLPEVILVTTALSVSYTLEKPRKFLKNETQKFYSGGFCPEGFVQGVLSRGFLSGGICPGGGCPRTQQLHTHKFSGGEALTQDGCLQALLSYSFINIRDF